MTEVKMNLKPPSSPSCDRSEVILSRPEQAVEDSEEPPWRLPPQAMKVSPPPPVKRMDAPFKATVAAIGQEPDAGRCPGGSGMLFLLSALSSSHLLKSLGDEHREDRAHRAR